MIKRILYFNLFTAATNTYVVWALLLGTTVANITLFFILTSLFATVAFFNRSNFFEVKKWVKYLLLLLVIIPLALSMFNNYVNYIKIILSLFYILIFLNAYAFFKLIDRKNIINFFSVTLVFTFLFGFVSIVSPEFFIPFAIIVEADYYYGGRAFGFFLQPNSYAFANILLFIGLTVFLTNSKRIAYIYLAVLISIILSGSRSNFLGFALISIILMRPLFSSFLNKNILSIIVIASSSIIFIALYGNKINNYIKSDKFEIISDRISLLNREGINESLTIGSVEVRKRKQEEYRYLIERSLLVGHGFGVQNDFVAKEILEGSAHNVFYEILFEGGIIYLITFAVFCIFLIRSYRSLKKISLAKTESAIILKAFLIFLATYLFFSSSILSERLLYIILSIFPFLLWEKKGMKSFLNEN